jgi:DNA-directed RNA polymerase subunit M/transcription elongation factor TFIIS
MRRRRPKLIAKFGGKCANCGYRRSIRALHFHHIDSSEKAEWGKGKASLDEVEAHPERFVLLCANCHAEAHDADEQTRKHYAKCAQCEEWFQIPRHRIGDAKRGRFCTTTCYHAWRRVEATNDLAGRLDRLTRREGDCIIWTGWVNRAFNTPIIQIPKPNSKGWRGISARKAWYELHHGPLTSRRPLVSGCQNALCLAHIRFRFGD